MSETFDIIIIGGSVSGAPTAMLLARYGYKVLLIEKSIFPRDTNSTHFIWPRGMSYLNRWGIADFILEATPHYKNLELNIEGISLKGCIPIKDLRERFIHLHDNDNGVIDYYCGPRRYFLDHHLLNSAKKAGAIVREKTSYIAIISEDNRVTGIVATKLNGSTFEAKAKIVIGADGRFSRFARDVGAKFTDYRELSTFAYYGYFSGINREELAIHKKGQFGTAIFPTLNDTQMALVYGPTSLWELFKKNAEQNFFTIFNFCAPEIAPLLKPSNRTEKFKACGKMEAFQRKNHGPGWALIGDAGSFKDQVTAMGITHAFRDAELITTYIHHALTGKIEMDESMKQYQHVRNKDYSDYFDLVCKTAEMNYYSLDDLKYYHSIKNNQQMIDQLISQFGDTLPVASTALVSTHETLAE